MVDEVLGNIYEVITLVAIADFTSVVRAGEKIFWNERPKGVSIEPDLTIGKDKDLPRLLLLISHTNAERASEKKFWRNIGEFVDARLALGTSTALADIVFDSGQKRRLTIASTALFDGFIEADRAAYGQALLKLAGELADDVSAGTYSPQQRIALVRRHLRTNAKDRATTQQFASDVEIILNRSSRFARGWFGAFSKSQARRPKLRIPNARRTSLRRGLGRLIPINNEPSLRAIVDAARARKPAVLPDYFGALELSTSTVPGDIVSDAEVLGLVDMFSTDEIVELWRDAISIPGVLSQARSSIALSADFPILHDFVVNNFSSLSTAPGIEKALLDCYASPDLVLSKRISLSNPAAYGLWLFDYLMTAIKAHSGKQQGYGYTKLGAESGFRFEIAATAGVILSPFLQRRELLRGNILTGVSNALARRVANIGSTWLSVNQKTVGRFYLRGLFEDKIYKIAAFDPLVYLLIKELNDRGLPFTRHKRKHTYLTHFTGAGSATVDAIEVGNTIILWQSASDKGVGHKMKELCGRVGMLRVDASPRGHARPGEYRKAILLIDGTWTKAHIGRLTDCGFDAIFYPHELGKLASAII